MFKLVWSDFVKGLVMAVLAAILVAIAGVVMTKDFNAFNTNWIVVGQNMINGSIVAMVAYLLKNFLTTDKGNVAGVIPTK